MACGEQPLEFVTLDSIPERWLTVVDSPYRWCLKHDETIGDAMVFDGDASTAQESCVVR